MYQPGYSIRATGGLGFPAPFVALKSFDSSARRFKRTAFVAFRGIKRVFPLVLFLSSPGSLVAAELRVGPADYASIQSAVAAAQPGDTIIVEEGVYRETISIPIDNLTLRAETGHHVVVTGLDPAPSWALDEGEVYYTEFTLPDNLEYPQVFINGRRINPAAYPDIANDNIRYDHWGQNDIFTKPIFNGNVLESTEIDFVTNIPGKSDAELIDYWQGGIFLAISGKSWQMNDNVIESSTATQLIGDAWKGREAEGGTNVSNSGVGRGMIVFHRNALDREREFHYDKTTGRIYLWQPGGGDPSGSEAEVRIRRFGLDLNGAKGAIRSDIVIDGITFYAAAADLQWSENCTIRNCEFLYGTSFYENNKIAGQAAYEGTDLPSRVLEPSAYSVMAYETNYLSFENNYVAHGWGTGVGLFSREWSQGRGNRIENNVFENLGWFAPSEGAVYVYDQSSSQGNVSWRNYVGNNTFRRLGSEAIVGFAKEVDLNYNYIATFQTINVDGGAIYLYGRGEDAARSFNWVEHGYDYIEPIHPDGKHLVHGLYSDGSADQHHFYNNVVWRCSVATRHNNESGDLDRIVVNNNTFWDIEIEAMTGWWNPDGNGVVGNMTTYSNLSNRDHAEFIGTYNPDQVYNNYSTNKQGTGAADLFVDATPDEFTDFFLKQGSDAIGFIDPTDPTAPDRVSAPDAGAYSLGESWTAGAPSFEFAEDDFEANSIDGGSGWLGSWSFMGEADITPVAFHGEYGLRLTGAPGETGASRRIDLTSTKVGTLSFYWRAYGREDGESVVVSVIDGGKEQVLRVFEASEDASSSGTSWSEWRLETIDLTGLHFTSRSQELRIDASSLDASNDLFYLDSLSIDDYDSVDRFRVTEILFNVQTNIFEISLKGNPFVTYRVIELDPSDLSVLSGTAMPLLGAGIGTYNDTDATITSDGSGEASLFLDRGQNPRFFFGVELAPGN
jgi:hypothetical protein